MGVTVTRSELEPNLLGTYDAAQRCITLLRGLTPVEERCVLAHELGHAHFGHIASTPAAERAAERFAARLLVDPARLRDVARWCSDPRELADELDVTEEVLASYLQLPTG